MHDDVVAVELLPKENWANPSALVLEEQNEDKDEDDISEKVCFSTL